MLLEKWPSRLAPCRVGTHLQIVKKKVQYLLGAIKQGMLVILIHEYIVFLTSSPFLLFL